MAVPLLTLHDIHLTFGGEPLLDGAELIVGEGERLCLVGRNGSGISSLLIIRDAAIFSRAFKWKAETLAIGIATSACDL